MTHEEPRFHVPSAMLVGDGGKRCIKLPIHLDPHDPAEHLLTVLDMHQRTFTGQRYSGRVVLSVAGLGDGGEAWLADAVSRFNRLATNADLRSADGNRVRFEAEAGILDFTLDEE